MGDQTYNCEFCGASSKIRFFEHAIIVHIDCPVCGGYRVPYSILENVTHFFGKHETRCFLYYNRIPLPSRYFLLKSGEYAKDHAGGLDKEYRIVSELDIKNWYPKSFQEKIDMILLVAARKNETEGEPIDFQTREIISLFFLKLRNTENSSHHSQINFYIDYFNQNNMLKISTADIQVKNGEGLFQITILPDGYNRIYELQKNNPNNKNIFVAMDFREKNNSIRDAIKNAIVQSEFSHLFMDEIIHNRQIVPEMLRLIKESKLLIMDITDPNYGAYFEAGYAMGFGKEVIITCKEEIFNKKDFKNWIEEKAFKPHFDIAQKQILVWKDEADLTQKLEQWIRFLGA
jgi:nucleoside 2-deoxyribosyltransferase